MYCSKCERDTVLVAIVKLLILRYLLYVTICVIIMRVTQDGGVCHDALYSNGPSADVVRVFFEVCLVFVNT